MSKSKIKKALLSATERDDLLKKLKQRFDKNMNRHKGVEWSLVLEKLKANPDKVSILYEMEASGGEPDVISYNKKNSELFFVDCSAESPSGRRSFCYDGDALASRKENKPGDSAMDAAEAIGIELLNEEDYRALQSLGAFDTKTSSWLQTPPEIRKLGGAIFGDRRYNTVFIYHNGAESYYAARGFRGKLKI